MAYGGWTVRCNDSRPCWVKVKNPSGLNGCPILNAGYEDGECPFAKAKANDLSYKTVMLMQKGGSVNDRTGKEGF